MSNILSINDSQFFQEVLSHNGLVMVDAWAAWCGPCRNLAVVLEEVATEMTDVKFVKINVDENDNVVSEYQIRSLPTLLLFKNGKLVSTEIGSKSSSALKNWIEQYK